jgi:hypothetical protein
VNGSSRRSLTAYDARSLQPLAADLEVGNDAARKTSWKMTAIAGALTVTAALPPTSTDRNW